MVISLKTSRTFHVETFCGLHIHKTTFLKMNMNYTETITIKQMRRYGTEMLNIITVDKIS